MKNKIIYTVNACRNIREIFSFLLIRTGDKSVAEKFVKGIDNKCKMLEEFPYIGNIPRNSVLKTSGYRFLIYEKYLIYYLFKEEENSVYILTVLSMRQDIQKRFEDLHL